MIRRCIALVLAVAAVLVVSGAGFAQEAPQRSVSAVGLQSSGEKSEAAAIGLELILPVLGHAYAGDAKRGILPAAVHVAGFATLILVAVENLNVSFPLGDLFSESEEENSSGNGLDAGVYVGLAAFLGGKVWGVVSAAGTARDYNRSLSSPPRASVIVGPAPDGGIAAGLVLRF